MTTIVAIIGATSSLITLLTLLVGLGRVLEKIGNLERGQGRIEARLERVEDKVDRHIEFHLRG